MYEQAFLTTMREALEALASVESRLDAMDKLLEERLLAKLPEEFRADVLGVLDEIYAERKTLEARAADLRKKIREAMKEASRIMGIREFKHSCYVVRVVTRERVDMKRFRGFILAHPEADKLIEKTTFARIERVREGQ